MPEDALFAAAAPQAPRVLRHLRGQQPAMLALLEQLVRAESPSTVPEAQGPVLDMLAAFLEDLAFCTVRLPGHGLSGGHLYARPDRQPGQPFQLLLGHCDTVWPEGTLATMPYGVRGNEARGPGIYDMKGGLVQMLFAIQALQVLDVAPAVTPVVFINSDEEIGSRTSRRTIERLARRACRAFVLEPALGLDGKLKTQRKGTGVFEVIVRGRSAHAGLAPETGASAIVELAYVIQQLHALNDPDRGITVNVGRIDGGVRANVVAPVSKAWADIRVPSLAAAREVEAALHRLAPTTSGTRLEVTGSFARPPLEATPRNRGLWEAAQSLGIALGLDLAEGLAGGGSDGCFTSPFTATLDGLGAVGDGAHAAHEFLYVDQMVVRSALLALLLLLPAQTASTPTEPVQEALEANL